MALLCVQVHRAILANIILQYYIVPVPFNINTIQQ